MMIYALLAWLAFVVFGLLLIQMAENKK